MDAECAANMACIYAAQAKEHASYAGVTEVALLADQTATYASKTGDKVRDCLQNPEFEEYVKAIHDALDARHAARPQQSLMDRIRCCGKPGDKQGLNKIYYDAEETKLKEEFTLLDNKRSGIWNCYHENGNLQATCTYVEGFIEGEYKAYHSNGQLKMVCSYEHSSCKAGDMTLYDEDGQVISVR